MVADDHERPRPERRIDAARGIREHDQLRPQPLKQQDRLDDEPGVVALIHVEAAVEHHDRLATQPAQQEPPRMTRRGRRRPTRQVLERDRDSILDVVGEPAQARAQDDPGHGD